MRKTPSGIKSLKLSIKPITKNEDKIRNNFDLKISKSIK